MPAWITISLTDLNDYLVGAQVNALNSSALASGQSDRFTRVMTDMVNRIRTKIEGCPRNFISATALTVPPELKWVACYLIIEAMQAACPTEIERRPAQPNHPRQRATHPHCRLQGSRQHPERSAHPARCPARRANAACHQHGCRRHAFANPQSVNRTHGHHC